MAPFTKTRCATEAVRGALLATHAASGLAAQTSHEALRLLRAAEGLQRAALAQLHAAGTGLEEGAATAPQAKRWRGSRRRAPEPENAESAPEPTTGPAARRRRRRRRRAEAAQQAMELEGRQEDEHEHEGGEAGAGGQGLLALEPARDSATRNRDGEATELPAKVARAAPASRRHTLWLAGEELTTSTPPDEIPPLLERLMPLDLDQFVRMPDRSAILRDLSCQALQEGDRGMADLLGQLSERWASTAGDGDWADKGKRKGKKKSKKKRRSARH